MAETNCIAFDFPEGESEFVPGFNVKCGGGEFALIFFGWVCNFSFYEIVVLCCFLGGDFFFPPYDKLTFIYFFIYLGSWYEHGVEENICT